MAAKDIAIKLIRSLFPKKFYDLVRAKYLRYKFKRLPAFSETEIIQLFGELGIRKGSVVFVHSSLNKIKVDFQPFKFIDILAGMVGPEGTLLFPCWQNVNDYDEYIRSKKVFDVKKTPTSLGLLPELARRRQNAQRSLAPLTSVVALGNKASEMVAEHHLNPRPCGIRTPFHKLAEEKGIILGIGISSRYLTFVHCVEDVAPEAFPMQTRRSQAVELPVKTKEGNLIQVMNYLPHANIRNRNIPGYLSENIDGKIARDLKVKKTEFFVAQADLLFEAMKINAAKGITIYGKF